MRLLEGLLKNLEVYILIFAIVSGQLFKIPLGLGGITLLDITVILFCLVGLVKSKLRFKKPDGPIKYGFIFLLVALVSLNLTPLNNLNSDRFFSSALYLIRLSFYFLFGYLIWMDIFPNIKSKYKELLILSGFGIALAGFLQILIFPDLSFLTSERWDPHYYRLVSTFLDPNFTGAFLVLTLLLIMTLKKNRISTLLITVAFTALALTFSRSSYLMFFISFLTLSYFKKNFRLLRATIICSLVLFASFFVYNTLVSVPRGVDRGESAISRVDTWQQGFELFKTYPILGVGFNTYRYALEDQSLADQGFLQNRGATTNDSSLLFVLSTTGIIGFIFYLLFLGKTFKSGDHILKSALLGLLIHSLFANSLFYPFILIWVIIYLSSSW